MSRQRGQVVEPRDVAADFHDDVYVPGIAAVNDAGLKELYPFKTEADLFLWLYERRRDLRVLDPEATFDDAAAYARDEGVSRRDRKVIESERAGSVTASSTVPADRFDEFATTFEALLNHLQTAA
jgi:hypothetical protein